MGWIRRAACGRQGCSGDRRGVEGAAGLTGKACKMGRKEGGPERVRGRWSEERESGVSTVHVRLWGSVEVRDRSRCENMMLSSWLGR